MNENQKPGAQLIALKQWERQIGVNPVTTWRWRKKGWLQTINICGRVYVSEQSIREFLARAEAGEFAQHHKAPVAAAAA